jgi:hypothetical protein
VHEFFDDIQESKTNKKEIVIAPQEGPQEKFVASDADIVIYGGQAGGGKTFGLLFYSYCLFGRS